MTISPLTHVMNELPEEILSLVVGRLDAASVKSLAMTSGMGRAMARARSEAVVGWTDSVAAVASHPTSVKVVVDLLDSYSDGPAWLMNQWPQSAVSLEWVGHNCVNMESVLTHDPRVQRQSLISNSLVLTGGLPVSLHTIKSFWLHDTAPEGERLSQVTHLQTMVYPRQWPIPLRMDGLTHIELEAWCITSAPPCIGTMLFHLASFKHAQSIKLKKFSVGPIMPLPDGCFQSLSALELRPSSLGAPDDISPRLMRPLNDLPVLAHLALGQYWNWEGYDQDRLQTLVLDLRGEGMVFLTHRNVLLQPPKATTTLLADKISCNGSVRAGALCFLADQVWFFGEWFALSTFTSLRLRATPHNLKQISQVLPAGSTIQFVDVDVMGEVERCIEVKKGHALGGNC